MFENICPGILENMLKIAEKDTKTYKICVDGKKISQSSQHKAFGDVDLWGHEGKPTLEETRQKLQTELEKLAQLEKVVDKMENKGCDCLSEASDSDSASFVEVGRSVLNGLERLKVLRQKKQQKNLTLEKLRKACVNEELQKKYAFALSAIKTYLYQVDGCIDLLLSTTDKLGYALSVCLKSDDSYIRGNTVNLSEQKNYVCLTGHEGGDLNRVDTSIVKQRSEPWHRLRQEAKFTGSTTHTAVGFYGLKRAQQLHDLKHKKHEDPKVDNEQMRRMQHGAENEIHAVATAVAKILPVYFPENVFVEEGCERITHNQDENFMIVSPDGSIREINENRQPKPSALVGVEIKCPFPGKVYTTPVYYTIPWYYAIQVLAEMEALHTSELLFICFSEESSTFFVATSDTELWESVVGMLQTDRPKRLPEGLAQLKERLKKYVDENVRFIGEVPSARSSHLCGHPQTSQTDFGHNNHGPNTEREQSVLTIANLRALLQNVRKSVEEAGTLSRNLASEVLVFLIADLDRVHQREKTHALPVAYGLKGYSLTSSALRMMLEEVVKKAQQFGLHVPVVSYDGQWWTLAVRSKHGEPLTALQLQKDIYNLAKKQSKAEILRTIKTTNIVSAASFENLISQVEITRKCGTVIVVHKAVSCSRIFFTSRRVAQMLRSSRPQSSEARPDSTLELEVSEVEVDGETDSRDTLLLGVADVRDMPPPGVGGVDDVRDTLLLEDEDRAADVRDMLPPGVGEILEEDVLMDMASTEALKSTVRHISLTTSPRSFRTCSLKVIQGLTMKQAVNSQKNT
jgi:hypothetical protein